MRAPDGLGPHEYRPADAGGPSIRANALHGNGVSQVSWGALTMGGRLAEVAVERAEAPKVGIDQKQG